MRRDRKVACVQHVNTGHNPFVANLLFRPDPHPKATVGHVSAP